MCQGFGSTTYFPQKTREVHSSFKSLTGLQPLRSFTQDRKAHGSADTLYGDFFFHYCGHIPLAIVQIRNSAIILHRPLTAVPTYPMSKCFLHNYFRISFLKKILESRFDVLYCFTCNKEVHSLSLCTYLKSRALIIRTELYRSKQGQSLFSFPL